MLFSFSTKIIFALNYACRIAWYHITDMLLRPLEEKKYLGSWRCVPVVPCSISAEFCREWWLGTLGWGACALGTIGSMWGVFWCIWLVLWDACLSCSISMAWTWTCWFWICSIASIRRRFVKSESREADHASSKTTKPHSCKTSSKHWPSFQYYIKTKFLISSRGNKKYTILCYL